MTDIKAQRRQIVRKEFPQVVERVNRYLGGKQLDTLEEILARLGRSRRLPHWYPQLLKRGTLPNLDGKTIGSVIEMLIVADIEKNVLLGKLAGNLTISAAKGVDLPDLELGIKSPSENWCTSEPFSNAYERLLGTEYDVLAVITNYQSQKQKPPLKIQLIRHHYFEGHEIADMGLCKLARAIRPTLLSYGEAPAKKAFKFLTYAVQSEWLCAKLLDLMSNIANPEQLPSDLEAMLKIIEKKSAKRRTPPPLQDKAVLEELRNRKPLDRAIIDAADDWVTAHWREAARVPNENEWVRLQKARLEGKLGVSFALQWRYNFGVFFNGELRNQNLNAASVKDAEEGHARGGRR